MRVEVLIAFVGCVAIAGSIPMPFRKEVPADETLPFTFARYRDDVDGKDYRLPNDTIPLHYDISLTTDVHQGEAAFSGKVKITLKTLQTTSEITLHYRQITIEKIDLFTSPAAGSDPVLIQEDITPTLVEDLEFLKIRPTTALQLNTEYIVEITYHGLLRDDNMGFYRSTYKNPEGQTVWLATTQFEQTDARHAFPCYDEPQIRATFSIEIKHDDSYHAISNMPIASKTEQPETNYVITKFQETLPVQTYLIAFIVSDFSSIENSAPKRQKVYAKPQSIENNEAELALDAGQKILDKFQEHLGVPYNLPKMDQVAVPDFDAGAMENWGIVTYREEYLLYNEAIATTRQRENILTIIAHEYAHQWFGNHVSPAWWSYLWLNEGFATLYENFLASLVYPEDRLMDTFVVDVVQSVLDVDASPSIRPMTYYVENPDRITALFDRVAYDKSGSVLRMMQEALGDSTWTKGLKLYLETMEYKSASSDDLYAALQSAVDQDLPEGNRPDISTIMRSWETQAGYPVITVKRAGNQLTFEQERFFYSAQPVDNSLWHVPINYVVGSNADFSQTTPDFWIPGVPTLTIESSTQAKPWTANDWIVVNIKESSYYRVNYDDNLWNLLIEQLNSVNFGAIHLLNRAQLVDDSLNLARSGRIEYSVPFGILGYLEKEADYVPWAAANRGMTLLNRWLTGSTAYANYQRFVQKIVTPLYNRLGVEIIADEPKLDRYARSLAINLACQAGLTSCLTQTASKLQEAVNGATIPADLQSAIYCNGLRQGTAATFNFLKNKMLASEDQAERTLIIAALGCSQDRTLLVDYLKSSFEPDVLRLQEKSRVLVAPVNNGELGLQVMMELIRDNFAEIVEISPSQVSTMLANIAPRVASQSLYNEFDLLLTALQSSSGITAEVGASYRASARSNLDWQTAHSEDIRLLLEDDNGTTSEQPETTDGVTDPSTSTTTEPTTLGASSVIISTMALAVAAFVKFVL